jgi:hypothetical protein
MGGLRKIPTLKRPGYCSGDPSEQRRRLHLVIRPSHSKVSPKRQVTITSGRVVSLLFPNAELGKNGVEKIFGGGFADDFADGIGGETQVHGSKFEGLPGPECFECE